MREFIEVTSERFLLTREMKDCVVGAARVAHEMLQYTERGLPIPSDVQDRFNAAVDAIRRQFPDMELPE